MNILRRTNLKELIHSEKATITLDYTDSVGYALKILADNGILSAPVMNRALGNCLGSVDVLDLISFVTVTLTANISSWEERVKTKFNSPLLEVLKENNTSPFIPVSQNAELYLVVKKFFAERVHRVPVLNELNELISVVSQSDVATLIANNISLDEELSLLADYTIDELGFGEGNVISVKSDVTLNKAFQFITGTSISGIAVVDNNGILLGNISASDFKGITPFNFIQLEMPVSQFIQGKQAISIKRDTTFRSALSLILNLHVHRLYIIDDNHLPLGVFTLTDLMKIISRENQILPKK